MSHILVAIATPTAAASMFGPLLDLARRLEAPVTVLQVLTAGGAHPATTLADGRETVEQLLGDLDAAGVRCDRRHVEAADDVTGAILDAAGQVGASLIFMGISGKSPFARKAAGDIPTQLLSRTHLPVLLVPPAMAGTL